MMSIRERNLARVHNSILRAHQGNSGKGGGLFSIWHRVRIAASMVHYEFLRNDVAIRAQSLSYFTLFSLLPLLAGIFLILGFFSQWGPVQKEFEEMMSGLMGAIPGEQRELLLSFILQFKDQYLHNLDQKSGSIGVFAILVLLWVAARVFFNLESLMNRIWSVRSERALLDRIKNFMLSMVFIPLAFALVISLPGVVAHFGGRTVSAFLDQGLLIFLIFVTLFTVLKGFPNTQVTLKSAGGGALAGTLLYALANGLLRVYFKFGTETAYGKAGVIPVFAFFIYVAWLIFMIAALVSLVIQQGGRLLDRDLPLSSLSSALILEQVVDLLSQRFNEQSGPMSMDEMSETLKLGGAAVQPTLDFLVGAGWVLKSEGLDQKGPPRFGLARASSEEGLKTLIRNYLQLDQISQRFDVSRMISRLSNS